MIEHWSQTQEKRTTSGVSGEGLHVTQDEVLVASSMLRMFRNLDHAHGAGAFAANLKTYIDGELSSMLARPAADSAAAVDRARIATGFFELAGYQAVDCGRPGWAQAYYARALQATDSIGDFGYGAYLVAANLAHLALHCGQPAVALKWTGLAITRAGSAASPATRAAITAVAARAYARLGEEKAATEMLTNAEKLLETAAPADEPPWIAYFNHGYLADEMAHALHDLGRPPAARRQVTDALDGVGQTHVRRLAIDAALLASTWLRSGDIEQACVVGREAIDYAARTSSGRCVQRLARLSEDLAVYADNRDVTEFDDYVHTVLPAAARSTLTAPPK